MNLRSEILNLKYLVWLLCSLALSAQAQYDTTPAGARTLDNPTTSDVVTITVHTNGLTPGMAVIWTGTNWGVGTVTGNGVAAIDGFATNTWIETATIHQAQNASFSGTTTNESMEITGSVKINSFSPWSDYAGINVASFFDRYLADADAILSLEWGIRHLNDASGNTSLDWNNYLLINPTGSPVVDWTAGYINDNSGQPSIHWNTRQLYDSSGNYSIFYGDRQAYDSGNTVSLDWGARIASGNWTINNPILSTITAPTWNGNRLVADASITAVEYVSTNDVRFAYATNGVAGMWRDFGFEISGGLTNRALIFPANWYFVGCTATNTLLSNRVTFVSLRVRGDTSTLANQTNCQVQIFQ